MTTLKRGDTKPDLTITLRDGDTPINLTTATAVKVIAKRERVGGGTDPVFNRAATSANSSGVVTMLWQTADTATPGTLLIEVEVTWPGPYTQTFPADGYLRVTITRDLG